MASKDNRIVPLAAVGLAAAFFLFGGSKAAAQEIPPTITPPNPDQPPVQLSPTKFVNTFLADAMESQKKTGVPYLVTLAQAAIESNWGKSAWGNNFFGIKADKYWQGAVQELRTWECGKTGDPAKDGISDRIIQIYPPNDPNGVCKGLYSYRVYGKFRKYPFPENSFTDHGYFLLYNKRYAPAFNYKNDPYQFIKEISKAGYATSPTYAADVSTIMQGIQKIMA